MESLFYSFPDSLYGAENRIDPNKGNPMKMVSTGGRMDTLLPVSYSEYEIVFSMVSEWDHIYLWSEVKIFIKKL